MEADHNTRACRGRSIHVQTKTTQIKIMIDSSCLVSVFGMFSLKFTRWVRTGAHAGPRSTVAASVKLSPHPGMFWHTLTWRWVMVKMGGGGYTTWQGLRVLAGYPRTSKRRITSTLWSQGRDGRRTCVFSGKLSNWRAQRSLQVREQLIGCLRCIIHIRPKKDYNILQQIKCILNKQSIYHHALCSSKLQSAHKKQDAKKKNKFRMLLLCSRCRGEHAGVSIVCCSIVIRNT